MGDLASVYSKRSHKGVFAIVGDTGNPTGDEGSLHLLQDLGYPFHDGKNDSVEKPEIVIRFYPNSNLGINSSSRRPGSMKQRSSLG